MLGGQRVPILPPTIVTPLGVQKGRGLGSPSLLSTNNLIGCDAYEELGGSDK